MRQYFAELTIGADPEFFICNHKDAAVVPIIGLLGGTKDAPTKIGTTGFAVQEDNVMAEYNIPPSSDAYLFGSYIVQGRQLAMEIVRKNRKGTDVGGNCAYLLTDAQLRHPQAQTFGCSPDFDAYQQGRPLPRIQPKALYVEGQGAWRFAGGHVHLGYSKDTFGWEPPPFVVAAMCDVFLSIPAITYGMDDQGERRKHYGSPGRYRPTPYGIEYRTLGNRWTMHERHATSIAFMCQNLANEFRKGEDRIRQLYNDLPWADIRKAISSGDQDECQALRSHCRSNMGMEVT